MTFSLPELPYAADALQPHISANTFSYHHGKHHNAYVNKANSMLEGTAHEGKTAEVIMKAIADDGAQKGLFNNVAQHWNHSFFWHSMTPSAYVMPASLEAKIIEDFGSVEDFKNAFVTAGGGQFGSGWVWLVADASGKLHIKKTANADNPLTEGFKPLLTCDVWEHAYYLDFQNARPAFLKTFVDTLANWEFAESNRTGDGFQL